MIEASFDDWNNELSYIDRKNRIGILVEEGYEFEDEEGHLLIDVIDNNIENIYDYFADTLENIKDGYTNGCENDSFSFLLKNGEFIYIFCDDIDESQIVKGKNSWHDTHLKNINKKDIVMIYYSNACDTQLGVKNTNNNINFINQGGYLKEILNIECELFSF